jgi:hypothetical protein
MATKKEFGTVNIRGVSVRIYKVSLSVSGLPLMHWFCAYATIKGSSALSDSFLSPQTWRDGDEFGVDTAQLRNTKQPLDLKLLDCLNQISVCIEAAQSALKRSKNV